MPSRIRWKKKGLLGPASWTVLPARVTAGQALLPRYRIRQEHSNSCAVRPAMNSAQPMSVAQRSTLEQTGQLGKHQNGQAVRHFSLPRQGVSLLRLSW